MLCFSIYWNSGQRWRYTLIGYSNSKYPLLFTYEQFVLDLHPEMSALVGGSGYLPHLFMVQKISITSHLHFDK